MSRMKPLAREDMNDEQAAVYDEITAKGGRLGGPYGAYIRIPTFMKLNQDMGDFLRSNSLDPKLRQLAGILAIRHWGAKFPWAMNAREAANQGLSQDVIDAINKGEAPPFADDGEEIVYNLVSELFANKAISDASYARAAEYFGDETLTNIIVTAGFYSMVSMTVVSVDVQPPPDAEQKLL